MEAARAMSDMQQMSLMQQQMRSMVGLQTAAPPTGTFLPNTQSSGFSNAVQPPTGFQNNIQPPIGFPPGVQPPNGYSANLQQPVGFQGGLENR